MSGDEGAKQQRVGGQTLTSPPSSSPTPPTPGKDTLVAQNARRGGRPTAPPGKSDDKDGAFPAVPTFGPNQRQYDLFFDIHRSNLLETTSAMLQQAVWPDPAPDAPFAPGGDKRFTAAVNAAIRSRIANWDGHRLGPLLYPGNPLDAFRLYIAADKEQMGEVAWSPSFGDAFARLVHQSIYESIRQRIGPRYRAALEHMMDWPEADQLIAGHPIDPIVAAAIAPPGTVDRGQIAVVNASGPPKLQTVKARWLGTEDPELWNFVEVAPSGASVEDVAAALWQDPKQTTNAYALTKVGDVFRVAPGHARSLLRRLYKEEVIGDSDSNPSRAQQLLVLSKSKAGDRVRARWSAEAAKANEEKPAPKNNEKHDGQPGDAQSGKQSGKQDPKADADPKTKPTISQVMEIETSIGAQLQKVRIAVAGLGMSDQLDTVITRHVARMTQLSAGDSGEIERLLPILQFQHTQLLAIAPRIPPLVEKLAPVFYIPPHQIAPATRDERQRMTEMLATYIKAASASDHPAESTQILAGVLGKEKQSALEGIGQVQDSTRQATRDGVATRVGSQQGSVGIDDDLTHAREDAMSGRNKGSGQYDEKKTIIRAGEISLRNRMNNVEQSIVMLREAAAAAGFSDLGMLKKVLPNVKPLPQVLLDVHDHLRAVDRAWARGRTELDENEAAQAIPQGAPEDWPDWQEREAGLNAAREEFAHIAGDEDLGTFLREAQSKIRTQQMINAVTTMASALLITMATGMGAAMLAETASVALVGESMTLAAQFAKGAIQVAISAPINSIVQLAVSGQDGSFGKAMLENALMDAFSRLLMFPLKEAERLAMAEVKQISQLEHVTALETKAMTSAASYAGTTMLAEGLTGMATQWAANRLVGLVTNTHQEVSEPFALTVLQQGAAIGLGRFFAGRVSAWQERRKQLAATRVGSTPEMHALFANRDAFYADAQQLENHPSPEPGAGDTFAKRDAALLRQERVVLGRDKGEAPTSERPSKVAPEPAPTENKRSDGHDESHARPAEGERINETVPREPAGPNTPPSAEEPIILSGDDAKMRAAAKRAKPLPGYIDVVAHADADGFWVVRFGEDIRLDHRSLATYLRKKGLEGQKIRLIACEAGKTPFAVAQHLANKLGIEVLAPTNTAWIDGTGTVGVGPRDQHHGEWKPFTPKESSQDGSKTMRVPEQPIPERLPGAPESVPPLAVRFDQRERYSASNHDELQAKVGKPLVVDPALGDGVSVEVHRKPGLFGDYEVPRVRVGPQARAQDVLAHGELINLVERYNGLLGKVRKLLDALARMFGKPIETVEAKQFPHGSRGWVLAKEVEKVRQRVEQTKLDAANGQIDGIAAEREIEFLKTAEAFFVETLRTGDPKKFDSHFEVGLPGPSTKRAQEAGYKLPGEPGGEVPGGLTVTPDWYEYAEIEPGVFQLKRKSTAPADAPKLQARVVNDQFQGIQLPEREPAPLLADIEQSGGKPLEVLFKPGMSMDRFSAMLQQHGIAAQSLVEGVAMHHYRQMKDKPRVTIDEWRHAVKEHFKQQVLDKMLDPKLDDAASYRMMRDMVDGLHSSDRGNLVEDWYRERYAKGAKRQKYSVERTGGENQGKTEDRVADMVQGGEIKEIKDVDGRIDEGQLGAHLDAVGDDQLSASLAATKVRYVFTKEAGFLANQSVLESTMMRASSRRRFVIEVIDSRGNRHEASTPRELADLFRMLRGRKQ